MLSSDGREGFERKAAPSHSSADPNALRVIAVEMSIYKGKNDIQNLKPVPLSYIPRTSVSTIGGGRGYDDSVLGEVTKTTLPGIGLHDPLHGR